MLNKDFGQALFGKNMPLDANKYFITIPDSLGAGQSSKPSDGLRANFHQYNYQNMINVQYMLLTKHSHIRMLYLIIGYSMGGMETWDWAISYPEYMTGIVALAAPLIPMPSVWAQLDHEKNGYCFSYTRS